MANGTIALQRTGSGYLTGQIVWSSTGNGTVANTSTVTAQLQIQRSAQNSTTGTFTGTFTVGGVSESVSWYGTLPSNTWVTVKTITATISHNADGNGSCYLYAIVNGPSGTTMEGTYVSGSSTVTLDWIPRYASIVSVTNFTDIEDPVITYSNPAGTAVSALRACISLDGTTVNIAYQDLPLTGTSYTFSLTEDERNRLRAATPNNNALRVYVVLRTVIGSNSDFKTATAVMNIVNAQPTISPTVVDTNSKTIEVTGSSSILVALHSTARVTINAAGKKYATIKSQTVEHGAATLTGDGTLAITNNPIKFTVIDSRNNLTVANATNTIVPYINPTCIISNNIPGTDGSFSLVVTGLFYNGTIGKTTNTLTVEYRYKTAGGSYPSKWTPFGSVSKSGNSYTATADLDGFDYQTVYTFQARVIDALNSGGIYAAEKAVISEPVFDWGQNDFRFHVPVHLSEGCDVLKNGVAAYSPSRYGLGEALADGIDNVSGLDSFVVGGFKRYYSSSYVTAIPNLPDGFDFAVCNIGSSPYFLQAACARTGNAVVVRHHRNGTWGEWEWVNPPMSVGVEYRTVERWNGKAVWTTIINLGSFGAGESNVTTSYTATKVIRSKVVADTAALPILYESARNDKYMRVAQDGVSSGKLWFRVINGTMNTTAKQFYAQVWYTKD